MNKDLPKISESYKRYILTIGLTAAVSWLAWGIVLTKLDPYESTSIALGLFFLSLLFALIGSFTLLGFGLRRWVGQDELHEQHLGVSLRQGVLLSICTILCIAFLMVGVLKWWNGLLLVTIAVLLEMFITSRS
ncbi:hypothetical protein HN748_04775 [Candidatus Peregrinibacteria bacterium]|jgi:hypothetical protein|nr:hypothetical protein [Candidatus Peregrinibacteria bacterium]MBT7703524.1 hypothetical protein [Candidatus Peregrinibacteria bacterium]